MIKQKDIYIIIVTYNGMKWLAQCLESTKPYPVIVVDNNSSDGTIDYIKNFHPDIKIFEQKANLGFGQANNIGISFALNEGADYVFLLNQDAYLVPDCLESLIKAQIANSEYGILSPVHLNGEGNRLDENFSNYLSYSRNNDFYSDYVLNKTKQEIYEVPFVNAAGWLISRNCLESVGGFDPIFFHYGEDDNYCQRVLYHGLKIGVVPHVFLRHDRENRSNKLNKNLFDILSRNLKITFSDINTENLSHIENSLINRKRSKWKAYLKLNFKVGKNYQKEIRMLEKIIPQIKISRNLNKQKGTNYLTYTYDK
ncbi:glycosyltransferase family 2 protein [uncultured Christiangramia sp.]|uniref:glycosyltransferase family 2 protein n=1 Tax=uncultured Christiangramia sp. TaxID=503836 RepID=UPI002627D7B3|nr:glycosyltransferase family 2 protein [uncultured Christiangramia sp.]